MPDDAIPYPAGTRRFEPGDEPAIFAIGVEAIETGELVGVTRRDLEYANSRLAHDPTMCAVAVEDDAVVGYVVPRHDELLVRRASRRRGHGTRLVVPGRAIAQRHGFPWLRAWVPTDPGSDGRAFAAAVGATYHSSQWQMRLREGVAVPAPTFPAVVIARWFEPGTDDEGYVDLVNDAFADHPSPIRISVPEIRHVHGLPGFDPRTIVVLARASDPGRLVAFARVDRFDDDTGRATGEIRILGVRPDARAQGLGRELLRWGVTELRQRGAADVLLSVEGENDRALGLYERTGFVAEIEWPHWTLPLD